MKVYFQRIMIVKYSVWHLIYSPYHYSMLYITNKVVFIKVQLREWHTFPSIQTYSVYFKIQLIVFSSFTFSVLLFLVLFTFRVFFIFIGQHTKTLLKVEISKIFWTCYGGKKRGYLFIGSVIDVTWHNKNKS